MNPIVKYLQETRAEMRHVAWPTQSQTIVYTILVVVLSVAVSLYLGLFDFIFTTSLGRALGALPHDAVPQVELQPLDLESSQMELSTSSEASESAPVIPKEFTIPTN